MNIPQEARSWLEGNCFGEAEVRIVLPKDIEGESIVTGTVGNEMSKETAQYLQENTTEDFLGIVYESSYEEWGSVVAPFKDRECAEKFEKLVRADKGGLRLCAGNYNGWYCYEAE